MNRGYAGFYKDYYLRSSYEYAYAKYLDYHLIPWTYESELYDLGHKIYKPDFFLFDPDGNLNKIIEIKSRNKTAQLNALNDLIILSNKINIPCELISYKELLELYKDLPFSLNSIITEWINSDRTSLNKTAKGRLNGHFGIKHSEKTKQLIGENTKKRWGANTLSKQRMLEGLKKSGMAQRGKIKTKRTVKKCLRCQKKYTILITSSKKYCSRKCSGSVAIELATENYILTRKNIHTGIREFVVEWSLSNSETVLWTPLNKISTSILPMIEIIGEKFGVKDLRVITKAVFGKDLGRKKLIDFMKDCVMKRYAELTGNEPLEPKDKKPLG